MPKNTTQLETLGDVSLDSFLLEMRNKAGINVAESIVDATIERTIEGASTLTVMVDDDEKRTIQLSGKLGRKVDVEVDGLWFTLVAVGKEGRQVTLTFEDRVVNALRYYDSWKHASRGQVTRAQFVLSLILEVKEFKIHYVIPELNAKQPVSDALPGETIIGPNGKPITNKSAEARPGGIPTGVPLAPSHSLTSKGETATSEQIGIANTVIATGVSMGARRKVLVCAIMTGIDESNLTNLTGGDRDSVGVFQQRPSQGWPASRNVAVDARAFYAAAIALDKEYPNMSYNDLCQAVQHSGTPYAYGQFKPEAEKFVIEYGIRGNGKNGTGDVAQDAGAATANNQKAKTDMLPASAGNFNQGDYQFYRGDLTADPSGNGNWILKKENSWDCMKRLGNEVNWRAFCVSGYIYFVSEPYLFRSAPFMTISEDVEGVDWIDYDYDEGKRQATVKVTCHIKRWSAPPGSTIQIINSGIINGKWLVSDISRSLFDDIGTITLKKPDPVLPEPTPQSQQDQLPGEPTAPPTPNKRSPQNPHGPGPEPTWQPNAPAPNTCAAGAVGYAYDQLGDPYKWGAAGPDSFDCSGLTMAAYEPCVSLPHYADSQWKQGPLVMGDLLPGDLVFFDWDGDGEADHVGIYIGNGDFIHAPHQGADVQISNLNDYGKSAYMGATRPTSK